MGLIINANEILSLLMSIIIGVDKLNLRTYVGVLKLLLEVNGRSRFCEDDVVPLSCQRRWSKLQITFVCIFCCRNSFRLCTFIKVVTPGAIWLELYCTGGVVE
jgi:hypothetical protein